MKVLTSKKAIIVALSLGSVVLAGTIKDINSRTVNKRHAEQVEMAPIERNLASEAQSASRRIAVMKVEMNEAFKIDGDWEVTRIVGSDETVTYDKLNNTEDAHKKIIVPMKLIRTSEVMVNNDQGLIYKISLLSDFGTIAIYKTINGGQEILEAKRVKKEKVEDAASSEEIELVLERALNQSKSTKILTGSEVSGEMTLTKGSIEGLTVSLTNTNGEVQNIEIASAQLMDGGSFKADVGDEEVAGVVFNNGKDGYRLSFVTGPLAGAMLNFVTKDALSEMENKTNEANDDYVANGEESQESTDLQSATQDAIAERREVASEENYEPVRILSAEEVKETAETQGFAF
jgi:hypothetical protein